MTQEVKQVMSGVLGVPAGEIADDATQDSLEAWDSVSHLNLVMALEEAFRVRFSEDQILDELTSPAAIASVVAAAKA